MQIVDQSSDRLVLHQGAWSARLFGMAFGVLGAVVLAGLIWGGHSKDHGIWVAWVVCGAFTIVGTAIAVTASTRQIVFDRTRKVAQLIQTGGVRASQATEVQFSEIRDIALESNSMIDGRSRGGSAYRIVFVLRDGSRVPWTTMLTSDVGTQAACAAAARAFGGWDAAAARSGAAPTEIARPTPAPGVVPIRATPRAMTSVVPPTRSPAVQNLGCVMAFLGLFAAAGAAGVVVELERLATWRPVPAVVLESHIDAVRGSKGGTSYRPVVTYTYRVEGTGYTSGSVTIIPESRSWKWASGISQRFRPGERVTAYVDPGNPSKAYLVNAFSGTPLVFVIIPLVFAAIVSASVRWQRRQTSIASAAAVPIIPPRLPSQSRAA